MKHITSNFYHKLINHLIYIFFFLNHQCILNYLKKLILLLNIDELNSFWGLVSYRRKLSISPSWKKPYINLSASINMAKYKLKKKIISKYIFTFCNNSSAYEYCEHWQKDRIVNIPTQVAKDCWKETMLHKVATGRRDCVSFTLDVRLYSAWGVAAFYLRKDESFILSVIT